MLTSYYCHYQIPWTRDVLVHLSILLNVPAPSKSLRPPRLICYNQRQFYFKGHNCNLFKRLNMPLNRRALSKCYWKQRKTHRSLLSVGVVGININTHLVELYWVSTGAGTEHASVESRKTPVPIFAIMMEHVNHSVKLIHVFFFFYGLKVCSTKSLSVWHSQLLPPHIIYLFTHTNNMTVQYFFTYSLI